MLNLKYKATAYIHYFEYVQYWFSNCAYVDVYVFAFTYWMFGLYILIEMKSFHRIAMITNKYDCCGCYCCFCIVCLPLYLCVWITHEIEIKSNKIKTLVTKKHHVFFYYIRYMYDAWRIRCDSSKKNNINIFLKTCFRKWNMRAWQTIYLSVFFFWQFLTHLLCFFVCTVYAAVATSSWFLLSQC